MNAEVWGFNDLICNSIAEKGLIAFIATTPSEVLSAPQEGVTKENDRLRRGGRFLKEEAYLLF